MAMLIIAADMCLVPVSISLGSQSSRYVSNIPRVNVDWPEFISRHDLIWEETPLQWNEGGFVGNGQLGMMIHAEMESNALVFHLGRRDVHEHNDGLGGQRMVIGRMLLKLESPIQSVRMRQHLWNAEIRGTIQTDAGDLEFRALTLRDKMINLIQLENASELKLNWHFEPGSPIAPRVHVGKQNRETYKPNPDPEITRIDGVDVSVHRLNAGGDYATAWKTVKVSKSRTDLFVSTANNLSNEAGASAQVAVKNVQGAVANDISEAIKDHRDWWHSFCRRSFLSIPDARLESFYWIQMYKIAAGTRKDGPALDLNGPWFRITQWPQIWWNLNIQLTYWPYLPANHMDLAETFIHTVDDHFETLMERFGGDQTMGDFAWALHNYWLHYRYEGDWQSLGDKWMPKAIRLFESSETTFIDDPGEGKKLRVKPMGSPEFLHGKYFVPVYNTNYNIALFKWLLASMLDVAEKTGGHPDSNHWKSVLERMPDPPVDQYGYMIGEGQSFDRSHRHYSHLMGFYPLFVIDNDNAGNQKLLHQSIDHWLSVEGANGGPRDICGYSLTGAASMKASLGLGDEALGYLNDFLDNKILKEMETGFASQVLPNTFYTESKGRNPVIETPLSAASATIELLLQSWGGKIRVFPAVPSDWKEAVFHDLRTQGAFLVSAGRKGGKTSWVSVTSLAGEPLTLKMVDWKGSLNTEGGRDFEVKELASGEYQIDLRKGETVLLYPESSSPSPTVRALNRTSSEMNPYGLKRGQQLKRKQFWPEWSPASK